MRGTYYTFLSLIIIFGSVFLYIGIKGYLDVGENQCQMTWMYEMPQYIQIPMERKIISKYPEYNLYAYGEGWYANTLENHDFHGIPVLFLPGNSGSYKQVRSLASVALRKSESSRFHFNYFVADFNGELSALSDHYIYKQTNFASHCIKTILRLYEKNSRKSLILIGHSMGGLISRLLFLHEHIDPASVSLVITLAAPHLSPVIPFDDGSMHMYQEINSKWHYFALLTDWKKLSWSYILSKFVLPKETGFFLGRLSYIINEGSKLNYTPPFVSIGGGERDILVRSDLISLRGLVPSARGISVVSTSIPRVWRSTDHLCIVWCNQLVLAINRALFDLVDVKTRQLSHDTDYVMDVLRHHFVSSSHIGKTYDALTSNSCPSAQRREPIDLNRCSVVKTKDDLPYNSFDSCFIFPKQEKLLLIILNKKTRLCLLSCTLQNSTICQSWNDWMKSSFTYPFDGDQRLFVKTDLSLLRNKERVILISKKYDRSWLHLEDKSNVVINLDKVGVWILAFDRYVFQQNATYLSIVLPFVVNPLDVYSVAITAKSSRKGPLSITARFSVPWSNEDVYVTGKGEVVLQTKFYSQQLDSVLSSTIDVWLEERTVVTVNIERQWTSTISQVLLFVVPFPVLKSAAVIIFTWFALCESHTPYFQYSHYVLPSLYISSQYIFTLFSTIKVWILLPVVVTNVMAFFFAFIFYIISLCLLLVATKVCRRQKTGEVCKPDSFVMLLLQVSIPMLVLATSCVTFSLLTSSVILCIRATRYHSSCIRKAALLNSFIILYCFVSLPNAIVWFKQIGSSAKYSHNYSVLSAICLSLTPYFTIPSNNAKWRCNCISMFIAVTFITTDLFTMTAFASSLSVMIFLRIV